MLINRNRETAELRSWTDKIQQENQKKTDQNFKSLTQTESWDYRYKCKPDAAENNFGFFIPKNKYTNLPFQGDP